MKTGLVFLFVALIVCNAHILHTTENTNGWNFISAATPLDEVYATFVIKQNNLDVIDQLFWEVSNPASESYAQYLTFEEIGEIVQNSEATETVISFLAEIGATNVEATPYGEFVSATMSAEVAQNAFQAEFSRFGTEIFDELIVRTTSYVIPEILAEHITHIAHISYFPPTHRTGPQISSVEASGYITPQDIFDHYTIDNPVATSGQATQSIFAALGQDFSDTDLSKFQSTFSLSQTPVSTVIGNNNAAICAILPNSCGEANLDVQYIMAIAQDVDTTFWRIGRFSLNPFTEWVSQLQAASDIPLVHSISYGGPEYDDTSMDTFNTEMQKLGLRGVSVLVASGDDGANSAQVRSGTSYCGYSPSFPASSPYITSVGATQGPEDGDDEVACSSKTGGLITTGGGFSTYFDVPDYQKDATSDYLNNVSPAPASGYNADGRGIPDVSFLGHNYIVVIGGRNSVVSGTSASSPAFAGVISLANDARLAQGKAPLGFLNQALYSLDSSAFNDITSGDNYCAAGQGRSINCCSEGFSATAGWDPLTGLGTPRVDELLSQLIDL